MDKRTKKLVHSHKNDEYGTPDEMFANLDEFYGFSLDPCATSENAKCSLYCTKNGTNGLEFPWEGHEVFVNPPYSQLKKWVEKSIDEVVNKRCYRVLMLTPARTDTKAFKKVFEHAKHICFISGRIKFVVDGVQMKTGAPFPSCLVSFSQLAEEELQKEREFLKRFGFVR